MANVLTANRINVKVASNSSVNIQVSNVSATLLNSSVPVTLKNNPVLSTTGGSGVNSLEELVDVLIVDKSNNSSISYSANTNKYEIKQLNLDGGTF
jgi:hypothetical protein